MFILPPNGLTVFYVPLHLQSRYPREAIIDAATGRYGAEADTGQSMRILV